MTPLDVRAYHDAGHAVVARLLGLVVTRVSIMPADPASGIVDGGLVDIDLDASRLQLGLIDLDERRAQTFVAGSVVQGRIQFRSFVDVLSSDGIDDFISLLQLTPCNSVSRAVVDAASYILHHGDVLTPALEQAWDTCGSWMGKSRLA
jgi:hypothetical protein